MRLSAWHDLVGSVLTRRTARCRVVRPRRGWTFTSANTRWPERQQQQQQQQQQRQSTDDRRRDWRHCYTTTTRRTSRRHASRTRMPSTNCKLVYERISHAHRPFDVVIFFSVNFQLHQLSVSFPAHVETAHRSVSFRSWFRSDVSDSGCESFWCSGCRTSCLCMGQSVRVISVVGVITDDKW